MHIGVLDWQTAIVVNFVQGFVRMGGQSVFGSYDLGKIRPRNKRQFSKYLMCVLVSSSVSDCY